MSSIRTLLLVGFCFSLLQACQTRKTTDATAVDSTTVGTADTDTPAAAVVLTDRLTNLGLTIDSDWRGVSIGDAFGTVKGKEKGEPFESDAEHAGYTVEFSNLESADVLYHQTNQQVSAIDADLYLNNEQSVKAHQADLRAYFTSRYGNPKSVNGGLQWAAQGKTITLRDVSKGKDYGLKVSVVGSAGV